MKKMSEERELLCDEVMSTPPIKALPLQSVLEGAKIMAEEGIGSLIIVDESDSLLGIVTKTDIIVNVVAKGLDASKVKLGEIMVSNPYYVFRNTTLREAAEMMGAYNIGHLPVLDPETYKVVGIISKRDIIRLAPHYIDLVYFRGQGRGEEQIE